MLNVSLQAKEQILVSEDTLIVKALWFDDLKAYEYSRPIYGELFDRTGEEEFLFREMRSALLSRTFINESINRLELWDKKHPDTLDAKRLLIPLYLTANQGERAQEESMYLLERSQQVMDLELVSNALLYNAEFERALQLLKRVYDETLHEGILLRVVTIMDEYTGQRKEAIALLETHRRMHLSSQSVYFKLLKLYMKENDINGLISTYEALYELEGDENYIRKIIDAYVYKRDLEGAMAFLEKHREGHEDILYDLYKATRSYEKAILLVDYFYSQDNDAKWLAEKGILLFEQAEDKDDKKMLKEVISHFEKAIEGGVDDSIYLNYYGYTLIDKEFDIKKGISIVEDALKQQPDNTFYLDSLAWGYYKQSKCKKAYELMKKVIEREGLEQDEIKAHWDAIQNCK
jgi:tetratricopeptide (TPR) repeat protein